MVITTGIHACLQASWGRDLPVNVGPRVPIILPWPETVKTPGVIKLRPSTDLAVSAIFINRMMNSSRVRSLVKASRVITTHYLVRSILQFAHMRPLQLKHFEWLHSCLITRLRSRNPQQRCAFVGIFVRFLVCFDKLGIGLMWYKSSQKRSTL